MKYIKFFFAIIVCLSCTSNRVQDHADSEAAPIDSVQTASPEPVNDSLNNSKAVTIKQPTSTDQTISKATKTSFFSFQLNIVSLLLFSGATLLCAVYISRLKYDFNQRYNQIEKQLRSKPDGNFAALQKEIRELRTQVEDLKRRKSIEPDQHGREEKAREVFLSVGKRIESAQAITPIEPQEKMRYMPAPNEDGSFDESSSSDVKKPIATLYEFRIHPNTPDKAEFSFCSDDNGMKKALSNPIQNVTPVCYEENDAFEGMQRVVMVKPGLARKEVDKWIVERKAEIRYE